MDKLLDFELGMIQHVIRENNIQAHTMAIRVRELIIALLYLLTGPM